jgi:hypothetical protein
MVDHVSLDVTGVRSAAIPDKNSMEAAVEVASAFVKAVAWGEHLRVWELMGDEGHRTVLRLAVKRGMDEALSVRLGDGCATSAERDVFLSDLVNGLRADLAGNDLEALSYWADPALAGPDRVWVVMMAPLPAVLGGDVPAGSLDLSCTDGRWKVERIIPRPSRAMQP